MVADTFDPEELVTGVVKVGQSRVGDETTIEVVVPPVVPKVHGDSERTRQVLLNLLDNAIKHSPSGGRIEVGLAAAGDRLRFTVQDQGLGIPVGEQERIFDSSTASTPTSAGASAERVSASTSAASFRPVDARPHLGRVGAWQGTTFAFEPARSEPVPAPA